MLLAVLLKYSNYSCLSWIKNWTTYRSQGNNCIWAKWARHIVQTREHKPCLKGASTGQQQPILAKWDCGPRISQLFLIFEEKSDNPKFFSSFRNGMWDHYNLMAASYTWGQVTLSLLASPGIPIIFLPNYLLKGCIILYSSQQ